MKGGRRRKDHKQPGQTMVHGRALTSDSHSHRPPRATVEVGVKVEKGRDRQRTDKKWCRRDARKGPSARWASRTGHVSPSSVRTNALALSYRSGWLLALGPATFSTPPGTSAAI